MPMQHLEITLHQVQSLQQFKQIHAQIILHSLHGNNYWVSNLLRHCTRLRTPPTYTRLIFDKAHNPNVLIYTSMLRFYFQLGLHDRVISLFHLMRNRNVNTDAFVFPILIKCVDAKQGLLIHAHVLKLGHHCDKFVRNSIMDMYAKNGPFEVARKLFDEMPDKIIADWNSILSGCWKWGDEKEATRMFEMMNEKNVVSWTVMVSGYAKIGDLDNARKMFDKMPERSVVTWNAMLSGYANNELTEDMLRLFENMMEDGVKPDETTWVTVVSSCSTSGDLRLALSLVGFIEKWRIRPNIFLKTALIDLYAKCGKLEKAREIFDEMTERNVVSWNAMMSGYARNGDLASAKELFDRMPNKNVISWNSMISGYAQNGASALAIDLFKEMIEIKTLKPDEVTMVSVISACGHLGALELGKWTVNYIVESQITLSISGYNALIFMYSKCGNMEEAKRVFQEMMQRDVISYNSLISGFAAHGQGVEAVELLSKMQAEGIKPDRITFLGVLTACSHEGLCEEGQRIFHLIKYPSVDHYACMIDLLGRAGKLNEARKLLDIMPMKPHAGVYGALLNASRMHRHVELGELAARELFELEPENSGNYVLLSNIYASIGKWKEVDIVREIMKERGLKKTIGCSWIEFNKKMHRFIVGDRSHSQSEEIYRILEELGKKMKSLGYVVDKSWALKDVEEEEKEEMVGTHSEKLALGFGILVSEEGSVIRIMKNLRVCGDCHVAIKMISRLVKRTIIVRDNNRFHSFKDGVCSCQDYW